MMMRLLPVSVEILKARLEKNQSVRLYVRVKKLGGMIHAPAVPEKNTSSVMGRYAEFCQSLYNESF
jgi:hypothetical protein